MEILEVLLKFSQAGSPLLLAFAVWSFATGRVVPRWLYDREVSQNEALRKLLEREKISSLRLRDRNRRGEADGP